MPLLRTYKRFDETTFFRYTVNWFSRKTEKGRSVFLEQCCITRTSSIKAKDRIVRNGSPLNTEGLTDTARKSMYTSSVMVPAILFLSSSCCFTSCALRAKRRSTPCRLRRKHSWRRPDSNLKKEEIR